MKRNYSEPVLQVIILMTGKENDILTESGPLTPIVFDTSEDIFN